MRPVYVATEKGKAINKWKKQVRASMGKSHDQISVCEIVPESSRLPAFVNRRAAWSD